jgi:hypothetical protein
VNCFPRQHYQAFGGGRQEHFTPIKPNKGEPVLEKMKSLGHIDEQRKCPEAKNGENVRRMNDKSVRRYAGYLPVSNQQQRRGQQR